MPSHPERVRRNYPEGVPQFGTRMIATVDLGDGRVYEVNSYPFVYQGINPQQTTPCSLCGRPLSVGPHGPYCNRCRL